MVPPAIFVAVASVSGTTSETASSPSTGSVFSTPDTVNSEPPRKSMPMLDRKSTRLNSSHVPYTTLFRSCIPVVNSRQPQESVHPTVLLSERGWCRQQYLLLSLRFPEPLRKQPLHRVRDPYSRRLTQ